MAFIAPALLLFIFMSIQSGLYFYGRAVAIASAREGVAQLRLAQGQSDYDRREPVVTTNVTSYVDAIGRGSLFASKVTATSDYTPPGEEEAYVSVRVQGTVVTLVPGLELKVDQTVRGSVERFADDVAP